MWILIVLIVISLILLIYGGCKEDSGLPFIYAFLGVVMLASLIGICERNIPTASDVYRGKTTLEITYKQIDTLQIPVDSTVVWKENYI